MNLFTTSKFNRSIKQFRKEHNTRVLDDVWDAINKIYNQEVGSAMDNHRLAGKSANGFSDIHLYGGKFILLYRYDIDSDTLVISAKIKDVVNHKELNQQKTFAEPQWFPTTLDEMDKQINGSTLLGDDLNEDDILDWFYDYYNKVIAPILPIDDIHPTSIIDRSDSLFIRAKGIQYYSMCPKSRFRECRKAIIDECNHDDITCNLYMSDFGDEDEYSIVVTLVVQLDIVED